MSAKSSSLGTSSETEHFKCVVFDTETTGLPTPRLDEKGDPVFSAPGKKVYIQPRVVQLGYVVYDTFNPENIKIVDTLIDITEDVKISEGASAVTGITRETIFNAPSDKKVSISNALEEFLNDISDCNYIVAHNVDFDRRVMFSEINKLPDGELKTRGLELFDTITTHSKWHCTMKPNIPVCQVQTLKQLELDERLIRQGKAPKKFYKFPRLSDTYKHYFGYEPVADQLHDAIIDVILCLRVFIRYKTGRDICGENAVITNYIQRITPAGFPLSDNCPMEENPMAIIRGGKRRRRVRTKKRRTNTKKSKRKKTTTRRKTKKYRKR
jgi:DNA polymerase III epsilon subunit-like protein